MDNLIGIFLNQTYTVSDIKRRLILLKVFIYSKFFGSSFNEKEYDPTDLKWLQSLGEEFLKNFQAKNASLTLSKLEAEFKKLKVLTVYVPFEIPDTEANQLGQWLRQTIGETMMFEVRIDPDLIGGAAFSWKGVYKDYSLRQTISERRSEILETFKGYVNV